MMTTRRIDHHGRRRRRWVLAGIVLLLAAGVWLWLRPRPLAVTAEVAGAGNFLCVRDTGFFTSDDGEYAPASTQATRILCVGWSGKVRWQVSFPWSTLATNGQPSAFVSPGGHVVAAAVVTERQVLVQSWRDGRPQQRVTLPVNFTGERAADCFIDAGNDGSLLVSYSPASSPFINLYLLDRGTVVARGHFTARTQLWTHEKRMQINYRSVISANRQVMVVYYTGEINDQEFTEGAYYSLRVSGDRIQAKFETFCNADSLLPDGSLIDVVGGRYSASGMIAQSTACWCRWAPDGACRLESSSNDVTVTRWAKGELQSSYTIPMPRSDDPIEALASMGGKAILTIGPEDPSLSLRGRLGKLTGHPDWFSDRLFQRKQEAECRQLTLYRHPGRLSAYRIARFATDPITGASVAGISGHRIALPDSSTFGECFHFSPDGRWLLLQGYETSNFGRQRSPIPPRYLIFKGR
ncbi:MAG: hypothetical protein ACYDCO_11325 [Armatimonadota bacterium]